VDLADQGSARRWYQILGILPARPAEPPALTGFDEALAAAANLE